MNKMVKIVNITIEITETEPLTFANAILGLTAKKAVTTRNIHCFQHR